MTSTATFQRWIESVCERFSATSGWRLCYAPPSETPSRAREAIWTAQLGERDESLGSLVLELSNVGGEPLDSHVARNLSELLADVALGYGAATRRLESHTRDLNTLVEIGRTLPSELDARDAIDRLLQAALKLTEFRSAAFFLLDPESDGLVLRAERHQEPRVTPLGTRRLAESPADRAALTSGKALLRTDVAPSAARWLPADCQTGCCVRVQSTSGALGALWTYDRRSRGPSPRELHVLESIASQVASVLERTVLLQESAVQQRLQRELKVASENQSQGARTENPRDRRLEVSLVCTSHHEIGGDLCEAISLDEDRTLVAVGDAAGDSIPAALVMSAVRGALWSLAAELRRDDGAADTAWLMRRLNSALHRITPTHQFMSLIVGVVDSKTMTFAYTNAGHPVPIVLRDGTPAPTESHGMLLGVTDDTDYESSTLPLGVGDLIVLYSDGISEGRNLGRRMFHTEGVARAVRKMRHESAETVCAGVMAEFEEHVRDGQSGDDRSLLVVRLTRGAVAPAETTA